MMKNDPKNSLITRREQSPHEKTATLTNEETVQQLAAMIGDRIDSLKYNKKTGKLTATVTNNGMVSTISSRVNKKRSITRHSITDVSSKEDRNNYILELHRQRYSQVEIADMVDLSQSMIHQILVQKMC